MILINEVNEGFIKKTIIMKVLMDIFMKLMFNILKGQMNFIMIKYFYQKA